MGDISVANVTYSFGGNLNVLNDVTLSVKEGEFVSIVGPSGCGKTTVLNLIAGLLPPQKGDISVAGKAPRAGRFDMAYMMARDALLPWLTAQQNAEFGATIRREDKQVARARATELLGKVGLEGFSEAYPKQLSHGMRQRVALARTFCMKCPILLMDEPFGALDAQTKMQLEDVLLELWMAEKRTVVFITHDLAEAIAISDRVVVMSKRPGRIQAEIPIPLDRPRSVRSLQKNPQFHEIYTQLWSEFEKGLDS